MKLTKTVLALLIIIMMTVPVNAFAVVYQLPITISNPTPATLDQFGYSVSVNGNNVLVGAVGDDVGITDSGAAYLFDATTGALLRTFNNPTPASGDQFGRSVSVDGNNVLISAIFDNAGASGAGSAYLFDATTGALLRTFNNPTPATNDSFGFSASISGNHVLVGAIGDNAGASGAASANIPISLNTQYYLRLERTPTQLTLSVFSDPARMNHIAGSPVFLNILPTDYANLNYVQHSASLASGSARTLTAQVDNTMIFGN